MLIDVLLYFNTRNQQLRLIFPNNTLICKRDNQFSTFCLFYNLFVKDWLS